MPLFSEQWAKAGNISLENQYQTNLSFFEHILSIKPALAPLPSCRTYYSADFLIAFVRDCRCISNFQWAPECNYWDSSEQNQVRYSHSLPFNHCVCSRSLHVLLITALALDIHFGSLCLLLSLSSYLSSQKNWCTKIVFYYNYLDTY